MSGDQRFLRLVRGETHPLIVRDESLVVSVSGDLNGYTAPILALHLLSLACDGGPQEIVVDLSDVSSLDLEGVQPLLGAHSLQRSRGGVLRIGSLSAPAARFLRGEERIAAIIAPRLFLDDDLDSAHELMRRNGVPRDSTSTGSPN